MNSFPWITLSGNTISIEAYSSISWDGNSQVFTVMATDSNHGTNSDLTFQVDFVALCLTTSINPVTWLTSTEMKVVDYSGTVTLSFTNEGIAYGKYSQYCGSIYYELLDSDLAPVNVSWVALSTVTPLQYVITATPVSLADELQAIHTFFVKGSINSPNYDDSQIAPIFTSFKIEVVPGCEELPEVDWTPFEEYDVENDKVKTIELNMTAS